jgi:hypothetical protein
MHNTWNTHSPPPSRQLRRKHIRKTSLEGPIIICNALIRPSVRLHLPPQLCAEHAPLTQSFKCPPGSVISSITSRIPSNLATKTLNTLRVSPPLKVTSSSWRVRTSASSVLLVSMVGSRVERGGDSSWRSWRRKVTDLRHDGSGIGSDSRAEMGRDRELRVGVRYGMLSCATSAHWV